MINSPSASTAVGRMEMLLRRKLSRRLGFCLLLLALVHEATGQRRKKASRKNNYRLHDDGGNGLTYEKYPQADGKG